MKEETKKNNDIEVLNVNKEVIKQEQHNGFAIKKNTALMIVKKIPANVYRLTVLFLAAVGDLIPDIVAKIPVVGYGVDALRALGTQYFAQVTSDEVFDKFICPLFNIVVDFENEIYTKAYTQFNHHEGKYFKYSLLIKTASQFVMEHPALIIAGGAALAGVAYRIVSTILKAVAGRIKYHEMNDKQKEVYELLKDVLENSRAIKKSPTGDVLVKDLKITYDIIEHIGNYPEMLDRIYNILLRLEKAIKNKNQEEYENCRNELEASVFIFDAANDNILRKEIHLTEETEPVKGI